MLKMDSSSLKGIANNYLLVERFRKPFWFMRKASKIIRNQNHSRPTQKVKQPYLVIGNDDRGTEENILQVNIHHIHQKD
jgi:negative regulator of replication initiation